MQQLTFSIDIETVRSHCVVSIVYTITFNSAMVVAIDKVSRCCMCAVQYYRGTSHVLVSIIYATYLVLCIAEWLSTRALL